LVDRENTRQKAYLSAVCRHGAPPLCSDCLHPLASSEYAAPLAMFQIGLGGVIVLAIGMLIGPAQHLCGL
jgi:hypothetical protein